MPSQKTPRDLAQQQTDRFEVRAQRALQLCIPLFVFGAMVEFAAGANKPLLADEAVSKGPVWQLTYLKANDAASVDSLARAVTANWFAMDAQAVANGDLAGYHLVRGTGADTTWDLLEVTVFRDSVQQARADSVYRTTYRPQHQVVLVGGKDVTGWGRIVRTETTRHLAGAP